MDNLSRAFNGVQTFYAIDYDDLRIAADIEAALLNAPEVRPKVQNGTAGFFNIAAPYHLRMALAFAGGAWAWGGCQPLFHRGPSRKPTRTAFPRRSLKRSTPSWRRDWG